MDFFSLIIEGDSSGIWTNPSGVAVDFSNPDSVNFNGIAEGFYRFNYQTNSAQFPCQEVDYQVEIEVQACLCPLLQLQVIPPVCNSQPDVNLDAFVTAGASGTWQVISSPVGITPATIVGSFLQASGSDEGIYRLRLTLDSAPMEGCPDSAEIDVFIQEQPIISLQNDSTICSDADISLTAVLGGSALDIQWTGSGSGTFSTPTGLFNDYILSADDITNTQVILIGATLDTLGFCPQDMDSVVINIWFIKMKMEGPKFTRGILRSSDRLSESQQFMCLYA